MNAQELKDFQEKERVEKERQQKEEQAKKEQQEKAQKEKETYQKEQEKAAQKRLDDLNKKHEQDQQKREAEHKKDQKLAEKARKPHSDLDKAREKMRNSPEHKAMRDAVQKQVADKEKTANEGAQAPHVVRDQGQQAEADKYRQMHQNDAKMALGTVGNAHGSPEPQGLNGAKEFEAAQATAALRAQGDQKPWKARAQDQQKVQEKAQEHGKGRTDHSDPDRAARGDGPNRPGPAPAPAHAHHGHAKPWHEKHGGHPDHASTILKDKAHALGQGHDEKPWKHQSQADPDRAESKMAAQAREREQEQSR